MFKPAYGFGKRAPAYRFGKRAPAYRFGKRHVMKEFLGNSYSPFEGIFDYERRPIVYLSG